MKTLFRHVVVALAAMFLGVVTMPAAVIVDWAVVDEDTGSSLSSTAADSLGNLYVASRSAEPNNLFRITLAKYTAAGDRLWVQHYAGPGGARNTPVAIALSPQDDIYIAGEADFGLDPNSDNGLLTLKYDGEGNLQWAVRRDEPFPNRNYARALAVDTAGNAWVTALTLVGTQQIPTALTVKYDPAGRELWASHLTAGGASVFGLGVDAAGNAYITGFANIRCGADDEDTCLERGFTTKLGPEGQSRWTRFYDVAGRNARFNALAIDPFGRITVTGSIWGGAETNTQFLTVQYASNGERRWVARHNDASQALLGGQHAGADAAGNIYIAGGGFTTIKYSPTGRLLWRREEAEYLQDVAVDMDGSVYAIGRGFSYSPEALFAVKYDACGNRQWSLAYNTNDTLLDIGLGVTLGPAGRVYLSGIVLPPVGEPSGILLMGLSQTEEPRPPQVSIRAIRPLTAEGDNRWIQPALFVVSREAATAEPLQVHLNIGGTALSGIDYRAISDVVTIGAGQTSTTIRVQAMDDRLREKTETVQLELAANPAYSLCDHARAAVYIVDNDFRR